jgi:hypothetical protein
MFPEECGRGVPAAARARLSDCGPKLRSRCAAADPACRSRKPQAASRRRSGNPRPQAANRSRKPEPPPAFPGVDLSHAEANSLRRTHAGSRAVARPRRTPIPRSREGGSVGGSRDPPTFRRSRDPPAQTVLRPCARARAARATDLSTKPGQAQPAQGGKGWQRRGAVGWAASLLPLVRGLSACEVRPGPSRTFAGGSGREHLE